VSIGLNFTAERGFQKIATSRQQWDTPFLRLLVLVVVGGRGRSLCDEDDEARAIDQRGQWPTPVVLDAAAARCCRPCRPSNLSCRRQYRPSHHPSDNRAPVVTARD